MLKIISLKNYFWKRLEKGKLVESIRKLSSREYIRVISVFLFFSCIFSYIYLSLDTFTSLDDQFFNIRYAELIREQGARPIYDFHWLNFSRISEGKQLFSYNLIFYFLLIPFTFINPLFLGIKIYGILVAATSFTFLYWFFLKTRIQGPFFGVMLVFSFINHSYIWKLLAMRSFTLAPMLLLFEIYLIHKKKYVAVFFLAIFYFFWHSATFFFVFGVAFTYFLFDAFYQKKNNFKILLGPFAGILLSIVLVIILFSFDNFTSFFSSHLGIFKDIVFGKKVSIEQGVELNPVSVFTLSRLYGYSFILLGIFIVFEVLTYLKNRRKDFLFKNEDKKKEMIMGNSLFFLSVLFLLGTFLSGRNLDFFVYFSSVYIIFSLKYILSAIEITRELVRKSIGIGFFIGLAYFFAGNSLEVMNTISNTTYHGSMEEPAEWLKENTNDGEVVFFPTMNWFPRMFYYNTKNYYVVGAEPKLLYEYSPDLYWTWWNISNLGYFCPREKCDEMENVKNNLSNSDEGRNGWRKKQGELIADSLGESFHSRFILTSVEYKNMNDVLENSDKFEKVYEDKIYNYFLIYKLRQK